MFKKYLVAGYKLILLQAFLLIVVAVIFGVMNNLQYCESVLLGGSVWVLPSIYFVRKLFGTKKNRDALMLMKDFFLGEMIKFMLSIGLIILVFKIFEVRTLAFLSGYIVVIGASFLMPLFYGKNNSVNFFTSN